MKRILLLLLVFIQTVSAQNFPVRVTSQVLPPYPTSISGYANTSVINSPLRVQLVLSDITASSREVRLRVAVEGNGISATSAPVVVGAPTLILDGGVPLNLTLAELAPYYELQNLQGISPVQYNSSLPDGAYRFCFEVFDAFNGNRLSAPQCSTIFLVNNQPPFLNKPDDRSSITEQNPTNIIFQWTPRHVNVPNVNYEFSLVEVWDKYIDPQAIFLASPPLYQETTINTSLVYGPLQPLLIPGKRYAWRVRAFANNNGEEVSVFNNNGNSEIFWFDYLGDCTQPTGVSVKDVTRTNATISWTGHPDHLDYTVYYREQGSERWYQKTTPRDYITIDEFKENTVYEYKVKGHCTEGSYGESVVDSFRTLTEELEEYTACGIQPDPVDLSNQELLTELFVNDVFTAGDFPVYVKEVSGTNSFTGEGYISTPWLATVRIPVKFKNIKINTDMKLVDGFVVTTYDPNWGSIVDADDIIEVIVGDDGDINVINIDADITNVIVNEDGTITITTSDGVEIERPGGEDVIYVDNTGETWQVGEDGTVTQGEQAEGGPANSGNTNGVGSGGVNEITATGVRVDFIKSGYYAVDTYPQNAGGNIANKYESIPVAGGGTYYPIYKAVSNLPEHPSDLLTAQATFNDSDITKDDIIFKTKEGVKVQANWSGNTATLSIKKAFEFGKEEIIAAVKPKDSTAKFEVAGNAYLWHLASQEVTDINVTLIPVNEARITNSVANRINEIYNPAGINFNVTIGNRLNIPQQTWDLNGNGQLDIGDSKTLAQYTEEEKAINAYFKANATVNSQMYYLFVTDMPVTKDGVSGFMPLKRQYGFVFDQSDIGRTAAHELGHGVFGLEHPFTQYNTTSGATDLLMDYGNGVTFNHMEWEKMHAPGIQIYWFQGDEDGESTKIAQIPDTFKNSDGTFTFMTLNGNFITLPKGVKNLVFSTGLDKLDRFVDYPIGALISFEINDEKYIADVTRNDALFNDIDNPNKVDFVIENLSFTYNGFKLFNGNKKYSGDNFDNNVDGNIICLIPYTASTGPYSGGIGGLRLIKVARQDISSYSHGTFNFFNDYDNIVKFYQANPINEKHFEYKNETFNYQYELQKDRIDEVLSGLSWSEKHPILAKYAILNNSQPIVFKEFIQDRFKTNDFYEAFNTSSLEILKERYIELINYIYNSNIDLIQEFKELVDRNTFLEEHYSKLYEVLEKLPSEQIEKNINFDYRKRAIVKLVKQENVKYYKALLSTALIPSPDAFEDEVLRLVKFIPNNDINLLITYLESYDGTQKDHLWHFIFNAVDDSGLLFWTKNNRGEFIKIISEKYYKSQRFADQVEFLVAASQNLDKKILDQRTIISNYKDVFQRSWTQLKLSNPGLFSFINPEDFYIKYDTDYLKSTGRIDVERNHTAGFVPQTLDKYPLKPFDLILFKTTANLSLLSDYKREELKPVPAIVLFYDDAIRDYDTTSDVIQTTFDLATLAIPGTQFAQLGKIGKIVFILDKASSVTSITANALENENQQASKILGQISLVTGVADITNTTATFIRAKLAKNVTESLNDYNKAIELIEEADEAAIKALSETEKKDIHTILSAEYDALDNALDGSSLNINKLNKVFDKLNGIASNYSNIVSRGFKLDEVKAAFKQLIPDNPNLEKRALDLFEDENFDELFDLFSANNVNNWNGVIWPPMDGFRNIQEIKSAKDYVGKSFDRFQDPSKPSLGGSYVSPIEKIAKETGAIDEVFFTYDSRMLADKLTPGTYYFKFGLSDKVSESINLTIGEVAPWFKKPASISGKQAKASIPFHKMDIESFDNLSVLQLASDKTWRKCIVEGKGVFTELQEVVNKLPKELADDLVDYINSSKDILKLFKETDPSKLDELIEAFRLYRKHNIEIPTCK